ncbi:MAG: hypothetical protein ACI8W9_000978, partial [Psychromonas sp.]
FVGVSPLTATLLFSQQQKRREINKTPMLII